MKRKTVSQLKKLAWTEFSKFIRLRDCLLTTGTKERGKCFTCDKVYDFKQLQAGHYVAGRGKEVLFLEINCHAQCYACNVRKHGNPIEYRERLVKIYGDGVVKQLESLRHKTGEWDREELERIRNEYKVLYEEMYKNN